MYMRISSNQICSAGPHLVSARASPVTPSPKGGERSEREPSVLLVRVGLRSTRVDPGTQCAARAQFIKGQGQSLADRGTITLFSLFIGFTYPEPKNDPELMGK